MRGSARFEALRALFRVVASGTMIAGAGGCGIDVSRFDTDVCSNGAYAPLAGVTPARPVDFLALREEFSFSGSMPPPEIQNVAISGTPCATATRPAECTSALSALRSPAGWMLPSGDRGPMHRYVVFTRGDEVGTITSLEALTTFLGPIDTTADAALLTTERGFRFPCGSPNARTLAGGFELRVRSGTSCGANTGVDEHRVQVTNTGVVTVLETVRVQNGDPNCAIGRRPDEFHPSFTGESTSFGAYLARMAALEALAVHSFERLARELRAHGAPDELIAAAEQSIEEEVRHARMVSSLSRHFGGSPEALPALTLGVRGLFELALENAVEGCVRESFGAVQATFQASRSAPRVQGVMASIAEDETRHAALSWDLASWVEPLLSPSERARVEHARREAIETLARELDAEPSEELRLLGGLPSAKEAIELHAALRSTLWSEALAA